MFISQTTDFHFANYRFSFRKLQILISQTTDSHFANYRFSFRKLQISVSQTTDSHFANYRFPFPFRFVPFRFANYSKPINFTNRLIPAKPKYLMSIENSQAILKYFIDLKSETSVNQTLDLRSIKHFRIAWLFLIDWLVKFIENTGLPVM